MDSDTVKFYIREGYQAGIRRAQIDLSKWISHSLDCIKRFEEDAGLDCDCGLQETRTALDAELHGNK